MAPMFEALEGKSLQVASEALVDDKREQSPLPRVPALEFARDRAQIRRRLRRPLFSQRVTESLVSTNAQQTGGNLPPVYHTNFLVSATYTDRTWF